MCMRVIYNQEFDWNAAINSCLPLCMRVIDWNAAINSCLPLCMLAVLGGAPGSDKDEDSDGDGSDDSDGDAGGSGGRRTFPGSC